MFSIAWLLGLWSMALLPSNTHALYDWWKVTTTNQGDFGSLLATSDLWLAGAWADRGDASFINIIKNFINRSLGILGLIALVVLLYGGFNMVTAAGDEEKYKKGFKILKQAAMGLIFIGLAFFMVSIIFRLVWTIWWGGKADTALQ